MHKNTSRIFYLHFSQNLEPSFYLYQGCKISESNIILIQTSFKFMNDLFYKMLAFSLTIFSLIYEIIVFFFFFFMGISFLTRRNKRETVIFMFFFYKFKFNYEMHYIIFIAELLYASMIRVIIYSSPPPPHNNFF